MPSKLIVQRRHKKNLQIKQIGSDLIGSIRGFHFVVVHCLLFGNLCCNNVPQSDDGGTEERETEPLN